MAVDSFDRRYGLGVPDELSEPEEPRRRGGSRAPVAPSEPFALKGCVLTPERKIEDGYVTIAGSTIVSVGKAKPDTGTTVIETEGVISPGLIDLHGHPEFNVFSAWEPPERYANRYRWRKSPIYKLVVRQPWNRIAKGKGNLLRDLTRYAEARALVGGVTAIQGASAMYPSKDEALVRNVDLQIFGQHKARASIDPLKEPAEKLKEFKDGIANGDITAFYAHLAEGVDATSENEFARFVSRGLLTAATVIIHGTALTEAMFADVKAAKAKLVWSPQSNLRLYGTTTAAARALDLGIPMGLGADWMPSGSQSLLDELRVARRVLVQQQVSLSEDALHKKLVRMVTDEAAAIAGLEASIGTLAPNRPADVAVFERHHNDPWRNVVEADPSWIRLVMIAGDLAYGQPAWIRTLVEPAAYEEVIAWGEPMLIDTSYRANAAGKPPPPPLQTIRANLVERFPQTGPIFA
jgi:5-methylthioadenosine/S-adenosylhomocysteine deaminase